MEYNIQISKEKYNLAALKVINCFLNLTDYELDIVSGMLNNNINILDTKSRAMIRRITGKSVGNTNNYIKSLKDKKILIEKDNGLILNNNIIKPLMDQEIKIKFHVS